MFQLFNEIGIIDQLVTARFAGALSPYLNPSEFGVLNHFVRLGDNKTPTDLARAFQMTKPSMTAILGKLVAKGYVEITPGETDKRQKFATLTEAGRQARERGIAAMAPFAAEVLGGLDVDDLMVILPTLEKLRKFLDEARNEQDGFHS